MLDRPGRGTLARVADCGKSAAAIGSLLAIS